MMRRPAALMLVSIPLLACGGGGSSSTQQVELRASGVSPSSVTVPSGGLLQFLNHDSAAHQIASSDCSELSSPQLAAGATFTAQLGAGPKNCTYADGLNPSATAFQGTVAVAAPASPPGH